MSQRKSSGKMIGMHMQSTVLKDALSGISRGVSLANTLDVFTNIDNFDKFKFFNSSIKQFTNPAFEKFSKNYINSEPEILFVAEYIIDDETIGSLLVWEKFFDSTHYEVYKKNLFQEDAKFERILFLDATSLEEETENYMDYLTNTVGLDIQKENVFVVLDTVVKEDRIYEYKIKASRVPKNVTEVDYDFILESKQLTKAIVVDQTNPSNLFDFAGSTLGSKDLAWTISILNETVPFFGRGPLENSLVSYDLQTNEEGEEFVFIATNTNNILEILNDSISLFNIKDTYLHFLRAIGGLSSDFRDSFLESIDETRNVFSYDKFRELIKTKVPVFSLILTVSQSANQNAINELSKLSIIIPSTTGSESLSSIEKITKILKFVNDFFISILYAQDNSSQIKEVIRKLQTGELNKIDTTQQGVDAAKKASQQTTANTSTTSTSTSSKSSTTSSSASKSSATTSSSKTTTSSKATTTTNTKAKAKVK